MLETFGKYTYQTDVVTVTGAGTSELIVTPVKAGIGRIRVYCDYNGQPVEKTIKFTVTGENVENNPTDGDSDNAGGCGTVTFDFIDFSGGAMLLLACGAMLLFIKRRKYN